MTDTVRLFIGSDWLQQQAGAEAALLASVEDNTTPPHDVTFMRAVPAPKWEPSSDYPWWISASPREGMWCCGCKPGEIYPRGGGWATPFTPFRWTIPELCDFAGYAIYQDGDQLDVGDMRELLELGKASPKPVYLSQGKACVMVLDCAAFAQVQWWPTIAEMMSARQNMYDLRATLDRDGLIDKSMPRAWNMPDRYVKGETKVCHYTNARTQPSGAYAAQFGKQKHPDPAAVKLWEKYNRIAKERAES